MDSQGLVQCPSQDSGPRHLLSGPLHHLSTAMVKPVVDGSGVVEAVVVEFVECESSGTMEVMEAMPVAVLDEYECPNAETDGRPPEPRIVAVRGIRYRIRFD